MTNSDSSATDRLRMTLDREAERYRSALGWDEIVTRGRVRSTRRSWMMPLAAAVLVLAVVGSAILIVRFHDRSPAYSAPPAVSSALKSADRDGSATPALTEPLASTGQIVGLIDGFPPASVAPATVPTAWAEATGGPGESTVYVFWATHADLLVVTTFGSSSCPKVVEQIVRTRDQTVNMTIVEDKPPIPTPTPYRYVASACTADIRPRTVLISPPGGITSAKPLEVIVGGTVIRLPKR